MTRATGRDQAPEAARVIKLAPMHQLMKQNIFPDEVRRLNQAPVEGDGTPRRAGAPAGPLVTHRDPGHGDAMRASQTHQHRWQFQRRFAPVPPFDERTKVVPGRPGGDRSPAPGTLIGYPGGIGLDKRLRLPLGAPPRQGDPHRPIGEDTHDVPARATMTHEEDDRGRVARPVLSEVEGKAKLHRALG